MSWHFWNFYSAQGSFNIICASTTSLPVRNSSEARHSICNESIMLPVKLRLTFISVFIQHVCYCATVFLRRPRRLRRAHHDLWHSCRHNTQKTQNKNVPSGIKNHTITHICVYKYHINFHTSQKKILTYILSLWVLVTTSLPMLLLATSHLH